MKPAKLKNYTTEQVRVDEVFLPYLLVDSNRTLSQEITAGKFSRLLPKF